VDETATGSLNLLGEPMVLAIAVSFFSLASLASVRTRAAVAAAAMSAAATGGF
jgi:hypothetical protein